MSVIGQRARRLYSRSLEGRGIDPIGRAILALIHFLYHAARLLKSSRYSYRVLPRARLTIPTISVGNPTLGGAGKTPFTAWLARRLVEMGARPAILSRGYGRGGPGGPVVVGHGLHRHKSALEIGDEAYILARKIPEAVVISGKRRASTGRLAAEALGCDTAILDDGLQYYRLRRDLDIALIDLPLRPSQFRLFPYGELREPLSRLRECDLIVLTRADHATSGQREAAIRLLDSMAPKVERAWASYRMEAVRPLGGGDPVPPEHFAELKLLALANVANPKSFTRMVGSLKPDSVITVPFPDHHRYTLSDEVSILTEVIAGGVDAILMTEKDEVNLPPVHLPVPAYVVELALDVRGDGFEILDFLRRRLRISSDIVFDSRSA